MLTIFLELFRESLRNLARHKLRSFLTALGIIFGIASVMSMVSTGEGARRAILAQISELGIKNIIVNAKKPPEDSKAPKQSNFTLRYGLTFDDLEQIRETIRSVDVALPVHDVEKWMWFKSRRIEAKVRGVTPEYFDRLNLDVVMGRTLGEMDGALRKRVCVVRPRLLREARFIGDPLTLDLRIGTDVYRVVGVLPDNDFHSPNQAALGIDDRALEVYVPFETVIDRYGFSAYRRTSGGSESTRVELHQIVCSIDHENNVIDSAKCIHSILGHFHDKKDYEVVVPLELLESRQRTQRVFNIVMPIIAGISLLVGGIGILNIMLASVTERIREIGIRRAIGATRLDITAQFLVETVTLTAIGGLFGVGLGIVGTLVLEHFTEWQPVITPWAVVVSFLISAATGIIFGIYPARRAATMDPIQALRHE